MAQAQSQMAKEAGAVRSRPLTVIDCRGRQSFGYELERLPVSTHMFNAVRDPPSSMASCTVIRACAVHAR